MVLCIARTALQQQNIPTQANGIYPFDLKEIDFKDFQFINRKICDDKNDNSWNHLLAAVFPQILPYIAVMDTDGKYLTYSRNGTETRLHGSRSIGIGGHIDLEDMFSNYDSNNILNTIGNAMCRELKEEASITIDAFTNKAISNLFSKLIVDTSNPVGRVHVGLFTTLTFANAKPQEELHDPQWLTVEELKATIDQYENWSKLIIGEL